MSKSQDEFVQALSDLNRTQPVEVYHTPQDVARGQWFAELQIDTVALEQSTNGSVRVGALWVDNRFAVAWVVHFDALLVVHTVQILDTMHEALSAARALVWGL